MHLNTKIVGTYFLGPETQQFLKELSVNTKLKLIPEPDNVHDPFAVLVTYFNEDAGADVKLGYVPRDLSESVANELEKGTKLKCTLKGGQNILISEEGKEFNLFQVF